MFNVGGVQEKIDNPIPRIGSISKLKNPKLSCQKVMDGLETPQLKSCVIRGFKLRREYISQDEDKLPLESTLAEADRQVVVLVYVRKLASHPPLAFREDVDDPHRLRVYRLTTAHA